MHLRTVTSLLVVVRSRNWSRTIVSVLTRRSSSVRRWRHGGPNMPMRSYLTLPNPLARLTGLIEAVEQARIVAGPNVVAEPLAGPAHDHDGEDLDHLSLGGCEPASASRSRDLEAMSLSRTERAGSRDRDRPGAFGA